MKYENMIFKAGTQEHKHLMQTMGAGAACRVTLTYTELMPDVKYFYKNAYHRTDGPAFIDREHEVVDFWIKNKHYVYTEEYCRDAGMSDEETLLWALRFGDRLPNTCEEYYGENWRDMALEEF